MYIEELHEEEDDTFYELPKLDPYSTHQLLNEFVHNVKVQFEAPKTLGDITGDQDKRVEAYKKFAQ